MNSKNTDALTIYIPRNTYTDKEIGVIQGVVDESRRFSESFMTHHDHDCISLDNIDEIDGAQLLADIYTALDEELVSKAAID